MSLLETFNNRILIIDDNSAIHEDFRKILRGAPVGTSPLLEAEQLLFGAVKAAVTEPVYVVDSAYQGLEGIKKVRLASQENKPYALAYVDVRMPPGLDGVETIEAIWKEYPELQIAICTAYSDYSWEEMLQRLGVTDNLLILKKPFDNIEVRQIACALTAKWNLNRNRQQAETEQRRLSEELKAKNIALEDDILVRTRVEIELVAARQAADQASDAKSSFLANMSHEIRTPINAVMGFNYLIQQTVLTPRQLKYASNIEIAAKSLLGLINSILDLSKVEAGKIELEQIEFNLEDVLSKLVQMTSLLLLEKQLKLNIDIASDVPLRLIGDPLRLGQVLLNLSSNAIKFTDTGTVSVGVELYERATSGIMLLFKVQDSGIGMDPAQRLKLFKPFVQADSTITRKHGGTGLGLAISKQFVNLMHGEIEVESHPGQGSIFSFTALFGEPASPGLMAHPGEASGTKQRALLIDPVTSSRAALCQLLDDLHFDVTACATREHSLIEILRGGSERPNNFDVLLLDASEAEKDWLTDVIRIREGFGDRVSPKIILIAGESMKDQAADFTNMGVDGVVFKPLTRTAVFDAITRSRIKADGAKSVDEKANGKQNRDTILNGARILLVEDDEINQQIASEVLNVVGCEVTIASNGPEALSEIFAMNRENKFHAVLMDLRMPGMDGLAVTRQVRADKRFADLPIIAMTADAIQGVQSDCLQAGMDDYLTKPINPEELFATLERWIPIVRKCDAESTSK